MQTLSGQVLAMERNLPRSVIYLGFVGHPMGAPAVMPIANVVTTVNARCRWSRRVVSLRTFFGGITSLLCHMPHRVYAVVDRSGDRSSCRSSRLTCSAGISVARSITVCDMASSYARCGAFL